MPATPTIARHRLPQVGALPPGPRNAITDVPGVRVGHCTLADGERQRGEHPRRRGLERGALRIQFGQALFDRFARHSSNLLFRLFA